MEDFDDFSMMDYVEEIHEGWDPFEEKSEEETLQAFLNSDWDF